jgi:hypothetical protein
VLGSGPRGREFESPLPDGCAPRAFAVRSRSARYRVEQFGPLLPGQIQIEMPEPAHATDAKVRPRRHAIDETGIDEDVTPPHAAEWRPPDRARRTSRRVRVDADSHVAHLRTGAACSRGHVCDEQARHLWALVEPAPGRLVNAQFAPLANRRRRHALSMRRSRRGARCLWPCRDGKPGEDVVCIDVHLQQTDRPHGFRLGKRRKVGNVDAEVVLVARARERNDEDRAGLRLETTPAPRTRSGTDLSPLMRSGTVRAAAR